MVHPVQSVVESLYAAGRCPRLHVNAMCEGVVCPDFIREQWQERLIIDLDSSYPLDLTFDDKGLGADLSFGGYVTRCTFPWEAIYVVADRATGRGIVLDQHVPDAVRASRQPTTTGPLLEKPTLEEVEDEDDEAGTGEEGDDEAAAAADGESKDAEPTDEEDVARRRAGFRVIDGGN